MARWKGTIIANDLQMMAEIKYIKPGNRGLGSWSGVGWSSDPWLAFEEIDTNIGLLIIMDVSPVPGPSGLYTIKFKGNGEPKGELARNMGVE